MMLGIKRELMNYYINDIQEFSGIEQFMDQPMKYYSSGMKARLGFSVAAHLDPEILILDEALNTGDAKFSKKSADKMKELVERAKIDRKSTRLNSSHVAISYAVFCLKKKTKQDNTCR